MLKSLIIPLSAVLTMTLGLAPFWAEDEQVIAYNNVTGEQLEKILDGMDIKYKKAPAKKDGVQFYDIDSGGHMLRLHNYAGQDLWLDCVFTAKLGLKEVNTWNARAKFSRAVFIKQGDKETISLESQLDCLGGVTDAVIRHFVRRFDSEVRAFEKFVSK
jgi:hypothetical protein